MVRLKLREREKNDIAVPSVQRERRRCCLSVGRRPVGSIQPSVVWILARCAPFFYCCFFAFFIPWLANLPQQALQELAVLVEMVDGIVVVGAQALHELVKVVRRVLLGRSVRIICRGGQRGVGRLAAILYVLFPPLRGGALVLILAPGLTFVAAPIEARRKRRLLGVLDKGPWFQAIRAGTPVDAARVLVWPEPRVDRRSAQGGRQVKTRSGCGFLCRNRWLRR